MRSGFERETLLMIAVTIAGLSTLGWPSKAIAAGEGEIKLSPEALKQCADAGVAECQFRYGRMLESGEGVTTDLVQARVWYEKAFKGGHAVAGQELLRLIKGDTRSAPPASGISKPGPASVSHPPPTVALVPAPSPVADHIPNSPASTASNAAAARPAPMNFNIAQIASVNKFKTCWTAHFSEAEVFVLTAPLPSNPAPKKNKSLPPTESKKFAVDETYTFCFKEYGTGGGALILDGKPVEMRRLYNDSLTALWKSPGRPDTGLNIYLNKVTSEVTVNFGVVGEYRTMKGSGTQVYP